MAKHAAAKNLIDRVISNDVAHVEEFLKMGDALLFRDLIRYEFDIQALLRSDANLHALLPKLLAYEIKTLSSFHLAAMNGASDIVVALMEKDVPVDVTTVSGTTALHLACFTGKTDVVNLLMEVYKADIQRIDRYGWSALHYASTEGHLDIVRKLVDRGMDVNARDQDGTTPAYRAHIAGHEQVVELLLRQGAGEEQLEVRDKGNGDPVAALYTKVNKPPKPEVLYSKVIFPAQHSTDVEVKMERSPVYDDYSSFAQTHTNGNANKVKQGHDLFVSAPGGLNQGKPDETPVSGFSTGKPNRKPNRSASGVSRSKTLPSKYKNTPPPCPERREHIRRIIRKELELSFGSEYETPVGGSTSTIWESGELQDIGVNTLTGLMREEFEKYKHGLQMAPLESAPMPIKNKDDAAYEDLYASLANLPRPPSPPGRHSYRQAPPPALPPRNASMGHIFAPGEQDLLLATNALTLNSGNYSNPALTESFVKLAPMLGKNWRKLAHCLPLEENPNKVDERITAIERQVPKAVTEQALRALTEWRVKKGRDATVDSLIIALRKCNLYSLIPEVEKVTQEFTA